MLVRKYKAEVAGIMNPAESLYVLELRSLEKPFKFMPGQFLHLSLDEYDPAQNWPQSRCFSIQSLNDKGEITLTFSAKGSYTMRMAGELITGKHVWLKMPYGSLFQDIPDKTHTAFIAGGTGITPFLSLFTSEMFKEYLNPKLYAGFRSRDLNVYDDYFRRAKTINPRFDYFIMYETVDGMLNIEKIFSDQPRDTTYFLSGPPTMIRDFKNYLEAMEVKPDKIRRDEWE
jgi:predicted ferric reductase